MGTQGKKKEREDTNDKYQMPTDIKEVGNIVNNFMTISLINWVK